MFSDSFQRMSRTIGGLRRMHRAGRTMAALSRLDDRLLNDIGIARSEIPGVAMRIAGGEAHNKNRSA